MHFFSRRFKGYLLFAVMLMSLSTYLSPLANAAATIDLGYYNFTYEINSQKSSYSTGLHGDSWTGAYTYSYPIQLPPGRNKLQPDLSLNYNSQDNSNESLYGYGWSMPGLSINRLNKKGVDQLYTYETFSSSLSGELVPVSLSSGPYGTYEAKTESGDFLVYEYNEDGSWTVTDKSGNAYILGDTSASRQDDPSDSMRVYKWMVSKEEDPNGNFISYTYTKDQGQIYPETIHYTGSGSDSGYFEIDFSLESRDDVSQSYATGFQVLTAYRVNQMEVLGGGSWMHRYQLNYGTVSNSPRSFLESVTESAQSDDGTVTTLPDTTFSYDEGSKGWTHDTSYDIPDVYFYAAGSDEDKGVDVSDINGDGLLDLVEDAAFSPDRSSYVNNVYVNNGDGTGWTHDSSYSLPVFFWEESGVQTKNAHFADVNGDGTTDILYGKSYTEDGAYTLNSSTKTWALDGSYSLPLIFNAGSYHQENGVRTLDVNGDGTTDFIQSRSTSGTPELSLYLLDPESKKWNVVSGFSPYFYLTVPTEGDQGAQVADINDDGLPDILQSFSQSGSYYKYAYVNQGNAKNWTNQNSFYSNPASFQDNSTRVDNAVVTDINADGLPDIMLSDTYDNAVYINQGYGKGWTLDSSYTIPLAFYQGSRPQGVEVFDVNGDNMPDMIQSLYGSTEYQSVYLNNAKAPLLKEVHQAKGATTTVHYASSTSFDNPHLPLVMNLVSEIDVDDGLGNTNAATFDYSDGAYYYSDWQNKEFAGFGKITKTENGRTTKTYYKQDSLATIGHPYQTDVYDDSGNLYQRTLDDWETTDEGDGSTFVHKNKEVVMSYDGGTSHRDQATENEYDTANGNLESSTSYGEVNASTDGTYTDTGSDEVTQSFTYATDSAGEIRNKLASATVTDHSGGTMSETKYLYDDLPYGSVSTGNLSSKKTWLDTDDSWVTENYTVDAYGMTDSVTDTRGNMTSMAYDAAHMYVATLTNALGQSTTSIYQYRNGKPESVTNANGFTSETDYDGLGRPIANYSPDPTTGASTLVSTTVYDDSDFPTSTITTSTVAGVSTESRQYFDGLGRPIQSWSSAESGFSWSDTWYDDLGNVSQQSYPYAGSGSSYSDRDDSKPATSTTYDALSRPLVQTTPAGITTTSYDRWSQSITDPNGNLAVHDMDAFGHLVQVDEHVGGATNSTVYTYDALGRMTQLTDPNGNVRHFTYDSLGHQTAQEDLHAASSGSFGTWNYTYDANGNRLSQTDPMGQIISWDYDALNRATTEDWNDDGTTDVSTTYDTATNGIGSPATVTMSNWSDSYSYDAQGHASTETKTIDGTAYTTQSTYDLLGRIKEVNYPNDAMTVDYTYNSAGQVESITKDGANILSNADYSPSGQVTRMDYGNGVSTTNTYDPGQNNRLVNKVTTGAYDETMLTDADGDGLYGYEELALGTDPNNPDTDGDQLKDGDEARFSDNPLVADTDGDGILDGNEDADGDGLVNASELYSYLTDPIKADTDSDGRSDYNELLTAPTSNPLVADTDGDGVWDGGEIACHANPNSADTDSDGLGDYAECVTYHTNANSGDTDGDGLGDYAETQTYHTNAHMADTDTDGLNDYSEVMTCHSDPNQTDEDSDGLLDYSECVTYHTNPHSADSDSDGLGDYAETITYHTNPNLADSDSDALGDYAEVITCHSNPHVADTDAEGLGDYAECVTYHTDPNKKDTDGDGYNDFYEVTHGRNPLDPLALSTFDKLVGFLVPTASASTGDIQNLVYTYDADGNITNLNDTSITPTAKSMTYAYDELNRLTSASSSGLAAGDYSQTYSYDALGNLTNKSDVGTLTYSGSGYPNPHAVTDVAGTAYTYDDNGNLTSDGTHTYTWNIKNQLASSGSQSFSYDPTGSRYKTVDGTDTTIYVNQYLEVRPEGDTYYIFNGSTRVASVKDSTLTYYSQDHLGGTALATSSSGTVVEVDDYYPYGDSLASIDAGETAPVHHTFTDKEFDDSLGLFYFEARWYNPTIGRFVSEDPMQLDGGMLKLLGDPQSLNFYTYARDNPVNLTDPTGRGWLDGLSNFISGVSNAVGSNIFFGAGRENSSSSSFSAGQTLGDAISLGIGMAETAAGLTVAVGGGGGGLILAPVTGGGSAVAGADAVVAGATLATYGTTVMTSAGKNLVKDTQSFGKALEFNGGQLTESEFLDAAEEYLGENYTEESPGRFVSEDGSKQVRYGNHETSSEPNHAHFESYDMNSGKVDENTKVDIRK